MLSVKGVVKRFGARTVLNYVSFDLAAGEYVAVIGESGIGKSTLLNVIAGLEPIDGGEVWFNGKDLAALDDDSRTVRLVSNVEVFENMMVRCNFMTNEFRSGETRLWSGWCGYRLKNGRRNLRPLDLRKRSGVTRLNKSRF